VYEIEIFGCCDGRVCICRPAGFCKFAGGQYPTATFPVEFAGVTQKPATALSFAARSMPRVSFGYVPVVSSGSTSFGDKATNNQEKNLFDPGNQAIKSTHINAIDNGLGNLKAYGEVANIPEAGVYGVMLLACVLVGYQISRKQKLLAKRFNF